MLPPVETTPRISREATRPTTLTALALALFAAQPALAQDAADAVGSVVDPQGKSRSRRVVTAVTLKRLTPDETDAYLASGEWRDKAGGYAIQGRAGAFVTAVNGSYFNVVGLPLYETLTLLEGMGFRHEGQQSSD